MMSKTGINITRALRNSPFFGTVSEDLLDKVARISKVESYDRGDLIFAEDSPCTGMYVVATGAVKIYKIGPDGREHVLHVAEQGETFGEAAMFLGNIGYPAYAGAVKNTLAVFIPKRLLLELLDRERDLCSQVLGALATWAHRLVGKLEILALKDASSRLAGYLLAHAQEEGGRMFLDLTIPKHTLASQLAISSETLSRLLTRFEAEGMIEVEGRHIELLGPSEIAEISDWGASET